MKRIITRVALALTTLVLVLRAPMAWALPVSSCAADFSSCNIYEGSVQLPFAAISGDVILLDSDQSVSDVFRIFNNLVDAGGGTGLGNMAFLYSDDEGNLPNPASYSANAIFLAEGLTETDFNDSGTIYHLFSVEPVATPIPGALSLFATGLCVIGLFAWLRSRAPLWVPGPGTKIQTNFFHQILPPTALILGLVLTIVWISFLAYQFGRLLEARL